MLGNSYNISELKKMSKANFYKNYKGKMFDIDKVWEWFIHRKKRRKKKKNKNLKPL